MRSSTPVLFSLLATLAFGCATQTTDDVAGPGGAGGKADGQAEAGPIEPLGFEAQANIRAIDATCLHSNWYETDLVGAAVKLICLQRGGTYAPTAIYIAAISPGEGPGVYEAFELPGALGDVPTNVTFRASERQAHYSFAGSEIAWDDDAGDVVYVPRTVTLTLSFGGDADEPTVSARYTKE